MTNLREIRSVEESEKQKSSTVFFELLAMGEYAAVFPLFVRIMKVEKPSSH